MKTLLSNKEKKAEAKACFEANKSATEMHVTVDGMCFTDAGSANDHAHSICNDDSFKSFEKNELRSVEVFTKEECIVSEKVVNAEAPATTKTEVEKVETPAAAKTEAKKVEAPAAAKTEVKKK